MRKELDRGQIVRAAVAVADEEGAAGLTMAAVAHRLGPYTAMALYRHVPSKDGLIDLMLDQVTGEIGLPDGPSGDWRADLHEVATQSWEMVNRHGWYAQLVHTRPPLGPNMMRRTELVLRILTDRGASLADAMTYAAIIDRHVFGAALQAAEEEAMFRRFGLTDERSVAAAITEAGPLAGGGEFPLLAAWMAAPAVTSPDAPFQLTLTMLLDGIAARLPD